MTVEANNYSAGRKTSIYFKEWDDRQKSVFFLPMKATIEENNTEVRFFERSNGPAAFQVEDKSGDIVFQNVMIPDKLEIYKIDLGGFKTGPYKLSYIEESIAFVGEFQIE